MWETNCKKGGIGLSSRFKQFQRKMLEKIREKKKKHGDSWLKVPLEVLRRRVTEEYLEWSKATNPVREMNELIDLANQCMLLWIRLRQYYEFEKSTKQIELFMKGKDE